MRLTGCFILIRENILHYPLDYARKCRQNNNTQTQHHNQEGKTPWQFQ